MALLLKGMDTGKDKAFLFLKNVVLNLTVPGSYCGIVHSALPPGPWTATASLNINRGGRDTHFFTPTTLSLASFFSYSLFFLNTHKYI